MLIDFSLFVFSHPSNKCPGRLLKGGGVFKFRGCLFEGGCLLQEIWYVLQLFFSCYFSSVSFNEYYERINISQLQHLIIMTSTFYTT